jgi:hypothetical protein
MRLVVSATQLTAVLNVGSRVTCHSFRKFRFCDAFSNCNVSSVFSAWEPVSPIKAIIWSEEPFRGFQMFLWENNHIYEYVLQSFAEAVALPPKDMTLSGLRTPAAIFIQ